MSTILNTDGRTLEVPELRDAHRLRVAVIKARWNSNITSPLCEGAVETFTKGGLKQENINVFEVPGTVELVNAAAAAMNAKIYDAIVMIGCVIRGDTPHFDYVCKIAAHGCATLNERGETPVAFGVITTENLQQALDRAGGSLGNKGAEAALAAIEMIQLHRHIANSVR